MHTKQRPLLQSPRMAAPFSGGAKTRNDIVRRRLGTGWSVDPSPHAGRRKPATARFSTLQCPFRMLRIRLG